MARRRTPDDVAFRSRLILLRDKCGLSGREMAAFVGVPKATMESWLRQSSPHTYTRRLVETQLTFLERELARKEPRLPIPLRVRNRERLAYVRKLRAYYR